MRLLIVCRHGNYTTDGGRQRLTGKGREEISALAPRIAHLIKEDERVVLLSSTAPRAIESAEELAKRLALPGFERHGDLSIEYGVHADTAQHLVDVYADDADVLILMTHLEYCRELPVRIAKRVGITLRERDLPTGAAQAIFMEEKRVRQL